MLSFARRFLGLGTVILALLSVVVFAASPLEEKEWRVEITPEGTTIPHFIDRLRFGEENFSSSIFNRKGFPASPYTQSEKKGGALAWKAKQKSDREGELAWDGKFEGETMTGTLVWKQADGKVAQYMLNGRPVTEEESAEAAKGVAPATKAAQTAKSAWGCSFVPF